MCKPLISIEKAVDQLYSEMRRVRDLEQSTARWFTTVLIALLSIPFILDDISAIFSGDKFVFQYYYWSFALTLFTLIFVLYTIRLSWRFGEMASIAYQYDPLSNDWDELTEKRKAADQSIIERSLAFMKPHRIIVTVKLYLGFICPWAITAVAKY